MLIDKTSLCNCEDCPFTGSIKVPSDYSEGEFVKGTIDVIDPDSGAVVGSRKTEKWVPEYPTDCKVAFVGMAPAKNEEKQGRPFVGWAGQVFRKTATQMDFSSFYIANCLLCAIPEDTSEKDQRTAVRCCSPRLVAELQKIETLELIIAFGNMPLHLLTGEEYLITKVAGRVLPSDPKLKLPSILPVLHPASLKHRPEEFMDYLQAMQQGKRYLGGVYQQCVIPKTVLVDTDEKMGELCRLLEKAKTVVVDLETTRKGFFPYGREPDGIRCMALAVGPDKGYIVPGESSEYFEPHPNLCTDPRLHKVLPKCDLIMHNCTFDASFLMAAGFKTKIYFDTMLAHCMKDERVDRKIHGLKILASKLLGAPDWEEGIKQFLPHKKSSYDLIPDEFLYKYATSDVAYTYQLYDGADLREGLPKIYWDLIIPAANMFTEIRHKGIQIDVDVLMEMENIMDTELRKIEAELYDKAGYYFNVDSPADVVELFYDRLKLPEIPRYGRSMSKKVRENYKGIEEVDLVDEFKSLSKLRGTYVLGMANFLDRNFRIHPLTNLNGAVTGRISTEDPSVMNISKRGGIKKLYCPDKGHVIVDGDNKGMELRCYAVIANDQFLKELLNESLTDSSKDPHNVAMHKLREVTKREITRGGAKTGVFGRMYGRGVESFIAGYRIDRKGAYLIMKIIDELFPSMPTYRQGIRELIHSQGYLKSYFERRRRFGLIMDENKNEFYRQGYNFPVQSMASDVNLFGMLYLWSIKEKLGIYPLFPVHDSIVMDVTDPGVLPEVMKVWEDYSNELVHGGVQFKVEMKVGKNWGETEEVKG